MTLAVLLVDDDDRRRREVYAELNARQVPVLEVRDAFDAMATLGRAEFGAVVLGEDRRRLSLRGLCHLARRRHPTIRLIVLADAAVEPRTVCATLGLPVDVLDADGPPGGIAAHVLSLMARPLDPFTEQPTTDQIDRAIADAFAEAEQERSAQDAADAEPSRKGAPALAPTSRRATGDAAARPTSEPLLEGVLEEETGTALLMGIYAQELTGRLEITGGAGAGTLYFYRGEPVAADHGAGNAGLLAELEQRVLVPDNLDIRLVPEGELLATLVAAGNVSGEAMHRFVGDFVRKRLLELVMQRDGTYRFLEDRRFLDSAPLLRVNPFGVLFERRRNATLPPDLQAQHDELRGHVVRPRPALRLAAEKLRPFLGGARVDELVGQGVTVAELIRQTRLDELTGTLIVLTLQDGRLVEVSAAAPEVRPLAPAPVVLTDPSPFGSSPGMALPELLPDEVEPSSAASADEATLAASDDDAALREEILSLYMRLKPVSHPRQVLGLPVWADKADVEAAYQKRMQELDPRRVPEGPSRDMLVARIEELRAKVIRAMEAIQFQQGARSGSPLPAPHPTPDDSNPF